MATARTSYNVAPNSGENTNDPLPVGSLMMWPTATAPSSWLICDGTAVSRTTYANLFRVIGTAYGAGDGNTTFNVPNLAGRLPRGVSSAPYTLAATGGSNTQTLTISNVPNHKHTIYEPGHNHQYSYGGSVNVVSSGGTGVAGATPNTGAYNTTSNTAGVTIPTTDIIDISGNVVNPSTGLPTSFSIVEPYLAINFIVKHS